MDKESIKFCNSGKIARERGVVYVMDVLLLIVENVTSANTNLSLEEQVF